MKRNVTWLLGTAAVVALLFGYDTSTAGPTRPGTVIASSAAGSAPTGSTGGATASQASNGTAGSTAAAATTRSVTGAVADTRWGPVQVQIAVSGGRITGVSVLQQPDGNGRDQEINSYALPILKQATLSAQSANIDMISGATVTSEGYAQSLQSAIDQAGL